MGFMLETNNETAMVEKATLEETITLPAREVALSDQKLEGTLLAASRHRHDNNQVTWAPDLLNNIASLLHDAEVKSPVPEDDDTIVGSKDAFDNGCKCVRTACMSCVGISRNQRMCLSMLAKETGREDCYGFFVLAKRIQNKKISFLRYQSRVSGAKSSFRRMSKIVLRKLSKVMQHVR
jgi:hypothetical protein